MGGYFLSLDNPQIWHGYPVDISTCYLSCIHGMSTLNPAVIHTPILQEHPDSFFLHFASWHRKSIAGKNTAAWLISKRKAKYWSNKRGGAEGGEAVSPPPRLSDVSLATRQGVVACRQKGGRNQTTPPSFFLATSDFTTFACWHPQNGRWWEKFQGTSCENHGGSSWNFDGHIACDINVKRIKDKHKKWAKFSFSRPSTE